MLLRNITIVQQVEQKKTITKMTATRITMHLTEMLRLRYLEIYLMMFRSPKPLNVGRRL